MNAFRKATKRITAVAASAAMVSSAVFGAGLSNYPDNFDSSGVTVVVGAAAAASDTTAAQSIIDSLTSGGDSKYTVTGRKNSGDGEEVDAIKSNAQLNYGENLGDSDVSETLDDGDSDMLEDGRFENGASDEDYTQELELGQGEFNFALRDNVDGVEDISDNIYYESGDNFANYTLEFDNAITITDSTAEADFVGETISIMGNSFTVASISTSNGNVTELELIGGANKVSLGEGESTTVTVGGKSYTVAVSSVSSTKVLISVNGDSESIDEYETEEVGGITIAVTDLVDSNRDSVKGYAEIVVGGQKITLEDSGEVQVNDEDVSDLYDGYLVESTIATGGLSSIVIEYKTNDDVSLEKGDSLIDPLFNAFMIRFDGTNEPEYSTLEINSNDDGVDIKGKLENGKTLSREMFHYDDTDVYMRGDQDDDRIYHKGSINLTSSVPASGASIINASGDVGGASADRVRFAFTGTGVKGSGFLLYDDEEQQYLYEISAVDTTDANVDVDEIFDGKDKDELDPSEFASKLEIPLTVQSNDDGGVLNITLAQLGYIIAFENEILLNVFQAESRGGVTGNIKVSLDTGDVDGDEVATDEDENMTITFSWDATDTEFDLDITKGDSDYVNNGFADIKEDDNDVQIYVTAYGTKVEIDNDESTYVHIMTPDEQVAAEVVVVFGEGGVSDVVTETFDNEDDANERAEELEDDGYDVDVDESTSEAVSFDVSAVTLDSDVSGNEDMIVVGGPAVNTVAADLLGLSYPARGTASGLAEGEAVIRLFASENSVLVYGWSAADTTAAAAKLNKGGLSGSEVNA